MRLIVRFGFVAAIILSAVTAIQMAEVSPARAEGKCYANGTNWPVGYRMCMGRLPRPSASQ
jgi:hypothetical protein